MGTWARRKRSAQTRGSCGSEAWGTPGSGLYGAGAVAGDWAVEGDRGAAEAQEPGLEFGF